MSEVAFAYGPSEPAVQIDRLEIAPGERVALVGGVGAGKSTLLKLLAGLYTPQGGAVTIGGLDLAQIAEDVARRQVGYLSQGSRLVRGSLRENLTMGLGALSDEELMETARATGLDALFGGQSRGLDIEVHEGGAGLSGGQRALVGINRLIHAKPRVWLLDEPSAALDMASEKLALDALQNALGKDDILIMATHKLALLDRFTRVVVMARGRVIGSEPAGDFLRKVRERRGPGQASAGMVTTQINPGSAQ